MINGYTIEEHLGFGSFGAVAKVSKHNQAYALKALAPETAENSLALETQILSSLNHPRIPRFIESFSYQGIDYLVQECVSGYPLSYYIANGKLFTEKDAKSILFQLLQILAYLHQPASTRRCVIHRDLRLSNLFWFKDEIYLIDFGCARYYDFGTNQISQEPEKTIISMNKRRPGTQTYALHRKEVSPRSDLFGAGVVGLDLFTNWIDDEELFQKPWQEILPASDAYKAFIDALLNQGTESVSAADILTKISIWHRTDT